MLHSTMAGKPLYRTLVLVLSLLGMASPAYADGTEYFRYRDHSGTLIIDSRLPPEYVKHGYDVINDQGILLKRVAPQATAEQIAARKQELEEQRQREQQLAEDQRLLARYSSVADIEASRKRVVDEISVRLSILRGNLRSLKAQIERQQEDAANAERAGRRVPESLQENLRNMEVQVEETRENIRARKQEITEVNRRYANEIERFEKLQHLRYGDRS